MDDAYFGNKLVSINQRRYLGSKTKLLSFIDSIIQKEKIEFESFADIFAGTGTVANHFCNRSRIIVNDILDSNNHIYHAFFCNEVINQKNLRIDLYFTILLILKIMMTITFQKTFRILILTQRTQRKLELLERI